ncbi:type VI secretion system membrane subunit TssM [Phyllobacterium phragmitis]|uniref:Type VI secretion system membrane subunit TssM n=1 Tax=Phyllobacterium phragmitis TaxID=2670329 RepID=A0A2S9IKT6_9HYPH|nr:type VI secretion system membrane subunit TssM [Phyllobacterium phragmitis]PRD41144.1 type VI secretion system membrane subunit TssM [Phyllobacterium phragmitis]
MNPLNYFYTVRSYVDSYAGLVGRRFLSLVWLAALCIVIWFYGYLLGYGDFKPLESVRIRLLIIALLLVGWIIYMVISAIRARRRDQALVDEITNDAAADAAASQKTEVAEIRNRLRGALALLRRITGKRFGYVYELPWYLIFGAPGSGKTTALTHSGLKFPLGDALGTNVVRGVGGTRNCNWWFTDEAILIDTAGRYTTQDDLNGASKAGWEGFLKLLRKYRRSQPVNGVLVTVSIGDLLTRDLAARREELRAIRQRLSELDEYLQARVPVYLLLTKADLLIGFVEFFDGFNKSDREQVWGTTFSLEESHKATELPERFLAEFTLLQERVGAMLLERLQQEPDIEARGRMFRFPAELASLKEKLQEVLTTLCSGSNLVEAPLLRGVYFVSGTQADENAPAQAGVSRAQRSYFLSKLFTQVIFGEASLVASDQRLSRRQLFLRRGVYSLAAVLLVTVLASWTATYFQNTGALAQAKERIDAYEELVQGIAVRDVSDADFLRILPTLDNLRAITTGFKRERVWPLSFGLDQEGKIESRHRQAYQRALNALLLPRMLVELQNRLADSTDVRETFDALKLYGMLGGLGSVDPHFVSLQAKNIFARLYPGEGRKAVRAALIAHAQALATGPIAPINLDNQLITKAREVIRDQSVAGRAYDILKGYGEMRALQSWIPADALGALGEQVFERASGASLQEGITGFFTASGYRSVVLPQIANAAREALNEQWVRGEASSAGTIDAVSKAALQLYFDNFEQQWSRLLGDIRVHPSHSLADAAETTRILASNPSPIEAIAITIASATDLRPLDIASTENDAAASLLDGVLVPPDPYEGLRKALEVPSTNGEDQEGESSRAPLSALQLAIKAVSSQLSRAATSTAEVAQIFDVDSQLTNANQDLLQEARRMPAPVDTWVAGIAADIGSLAVKTARSRVDTLWESDGVLCSSIVTGRYPFVRSSLHDVAMHDFVRLFGPNGIFHTFFQERLKAFVDTSTSPWTWRGTFGAPGMPSKALAQFENADKIRRAFFQSNSESPNISINIKPLSLSDSAGAVMLEIEGERVVYFHGPVQSKTISWPSSQAINLSRIAFQPGGWKQAITETGDWSAFRLFDRAEITNESDDLFHARFKSSGHTADFEVQFGSVLTPFRLKALSDFSCPSQF